METSIARRACVPELGASVRGPRGRTPRRGGSWGLGLVARGEVAVVCSLRLPEGQSRRRAWCLKPTKSKIGTAKPVKFKRVFFCFVFPK